MGTLVSPGVSITITDESFGSGSPQGTVPLIILATAQDKLTAAGDDIASGTTKQNANKLYSLSSQRELLQTFGVPNFNTIGGSSLHGYPLNEYGLLAAHSYLGIANRVFCVRADIDLDELQPSDFAPIAPPRAGTYWLNPANVDPAVYLGVNGRWVKQSVTIHTGGVNSMGAPLSVENSANYALVIGRRDVSGTIFENQLWKKIGANWVMVDANDYSDYEYAGVWPTVQNGGLWVNTRAAKYEIGAYSEASGKFVVATLPLFSTTGEANASFGSPKSGDMFVHYDTKVVNSDGTIATAYGDGARHLIKRHNGKKVTQFVSTHVFPTPMSAQMKINGVDVVISGATSADAAATTINAAFGNTGAIFASDIGGKLAISDSYGDDITIELTTGPLSGLILGTTVISNWSPLAYEFADVEPTGELADGTLWYSSEFKVDILKKIGNDWVTENAYVQTTAPESPNTGDVWVDTDQSDYPTIFKFDGSWVRVDNSDQTTPDGIIFADARVSPTDAHDADIPDAAMYPEGMLLWNTRYSTRVVKEYYSNYVYEGTAMGPRWVMRSGLDFDGSLVTGNAAIKKVVVQAMAAAIVDNDDIRSEFVFYNLIAAPGFPELIDEMVSLNIDKKEHAFVIGDTPMTLKPDTTSLVEWATNDNQSPTNGDRGLITRDGYLGIYYPSGLATNLDGTEVVVPASHMLLRTYAYNDQVSYPWFVPAGLQRGVINNAVSVGYIDDEGEFVPVALNQGQRDVLYLNDINPIKMDPNAGLVVWGQKTRYPIDSSARTRVNVARLINYISYRLEVIVQPYFFQPNDVKTRGSVKTNIDSFLGELVSLRGVTDFLVVCDSSNNTNSRIDRNELWIDIALVPTKAIEFIYIPVRIKSTGADLSA